MTYKEPIVMSWSGGKDSALALYNIMQSNEYEVKYLLTTIYEPNKRVSMHGVPESLIEIQAASIGIPLEKIYIKESSHNEYEIKMKEVLQKFKEEGINKVVFGDIFLEDLKEYRESKLAEVNMEGVFPLWNKSTNTLAKTFISKGFKTHICSIDLSKLPKHLLGRDFNNYFLENLPKNIDPCGENGEFHSFCYDGPLFNKRINFKINGTSIQKYVHNKREFKFGFSDISL